MICIVTNIYKMLKTPITTEFFLHMYTHTQTEEERERKRKILLKEEREASSFGGDIKIIMGFYQNIKM